MMVIMDIVVLVNVGLLHLNNLRIFTLDLKINK